MSREPSMEEILSSIRRVIARDEAARESSLEERFGDVSAATDETALDDDVLDLTDVEAPVFTDAAAEAGPAAPLVSADSQDAARHAIGQLTAALEQSGDERPVTAAATPGMTIEAMAEAALRPMLKTWLDANLPPLVERLVAREIARITGSKL